MHINVCTKTAFLLMALPQSLTALAEWLGATDLSSLLVTCYYCGNFLGWHDKILYENANLYVIWKDGGFYAVCHCCTRGTARLDFMRNFGGVYSVEEVQLQYNSSILDLTLRCVSCLRELSRQEKTDVALSAPDIYLVRDSLRVLCVVCKIVQ